jgi:hypothetical protein
MIDEVRIYGTSLTQSDVSALWNSGSGDLGIIPVIVMDKNHAATEVNGTIQFFQVGNKVNVTGFDSSDLTIEGATLASFIDDSNGTFSISLIPTTPVLRFTSPLQPTPPQDLTVLLQPGPPPFDSINLRLLLQRKAWSYGITLREMTPKRFMIFLPEK